MQVFKYIIEIGSNNISMPQNAKILSARMQGANICLWALCNENAILENRTIEVYGTGWDIKFSEDLVFIDTTITNNGQFVWHVFERI